MKQSIKQKIKNLKTPQREIQMYSCAADEELIFFGKDDSDAKGNRRDMYGCRPLPKTQYIVLYASIIKHPKEQLWKPYFKIAQTLEEVEELKERIRDDWRINKLDAFPMFKIIEFKD